MSKELGTLVIVVLKARNLKDKHSFYKQDAFAKLSFGGIDQQTKVDKKGGQHPIWDEEIRVSVPKDSSEKNRTLHISCWAQEPKTVDILGQGKVNISETLRTGEFDDWIPLDLDGVYRGDIFLEMTFYANAPAPLNRRASKWNPKERLSRPDQLYKYPNAGTSSPPSRTGKLPPASTSPKRRHLVPPSSRSPSSSPKNRNDTLPALPEALGGSPPSRSYVPAALAAGPGAGLSAGGGAPVGVKPVPSILRPGNPKSSPTPVGPSRPVPSNEYTSPTHRYQPDDPIQPLVAANPYTSPMSFPMASIGNVGGHQPIYDGQSYDYRRPSPEPTSVSAYPPSSDNNDLPDPYLAARYQQPLPLPGGGGFRPSASPPRAAPAPVRRDPAAEAAEIRKQAALAEERARQTKREQEEADAELARQLDRELNID